MARFFHRIGAQPHHFQFDLSIMSVNLFLPVEIRIFVLWKRGPKRVETK